MDRDAKIVNSLVSLAMMLASACGAATSANGSEGPAGKKVKGASTAVSAVASTAASTVADLVMTHGAIYTENACRSWATGMAIKDGKFLYVGNDDEAKRFVGPSTTVVDLHDMMVLPGFHDCHVHPIESGVQLSDCVLDDLESAASILNAVADYSKKNPDLPWIVGSGWSLPAFPNANPQKSELDKVVAERPAYLVSQDGHSAWVNSKALALAGITRATADPVRGRIERDTTGEPSGTLRESAVHLLDPVLPKKTLNELTNGARRALALASSYGITSLQDANVSEQYLQAYTELEKKGELTVRVTAALSVDAALDSSQVANLVKQREQYSSELLKPTSAKIFADGVIEAHTAALLEPYSDKPDSCGILNYPIERLKDLIAELDKNKFQVHVHAIGDAAVHHTLDAFSDAIKKNGARDSRHQIAHLELIAPTDLPRFRELGVVANFEPFWCFRDKYISECTEPFIGPERSSRLYQIHSVMETGAVVSAGSDWNVSSLNPLDAIQVAITRRALADKDSPAWLMHERVDLTDILAAYTINGAYANHEENLTGSIEVGKAADFIVLDHNLFLLPKSDIHLTKVTKTYVDGNQVYPPVRCY